MKITPENIATRHAKHPEATAQLIEYYANQKVRDHLERLYSRSAITSIPSSGTIVIVSDYDVWAKFKDCDLFRGLNIDVLQKVNNELSPTPATPETFPPES